MQGNFSEIKTKIFLFPMIFPIVLMIIAVEDAKIGKHFLRYII